ncbi:CLUMA_CG007450, isoform A [Clunio marinus]|uniref:CLUMA_CG007450, isoform A n=1 Tax=Clunio marinus TaxID=568069 RepID=A0A1J1I142_9DIPT|nr:CLUMA_CG007450, isoform A [Clunio marinus]
MTTGCCSFNEETITRKEWNCCQHWPKNSLNDCCFLVDVKGIQEIEDYRQLFNDGLGGINVQHKWLKRSALLNTCLYDIIYEKRREKFYILKKLHP